MVRLIAFSSYLTRCVILTRVETENDSYAFDIFDALNTTGEPLTALETLRPGIIQFEDNKDGFEGSESQRCLAKLRENLDEVFVQTELRQKATKELLVSFALYFEGHKLGMPLNAQRTYLRMDLRVIPRMREARNLAVGSLSLFQIWLNFAFGIGTWIKSGVWTHIIRRAFRIH